MTDGDEGGRAGPLAVTQHPGAVVELIHEPRDGSAASWIAPALPACIGPLRRRLATFAEGHTDSATLVGDIRLAVSEAITNVVIHAYRDRDVPGTVTAAIAATTGGQVEVVVTDVGMGMSPRSDSPGAGLGLTVMAAACDRVTICAGATGKGTEVRMTFARR